jgi:hypothetical protein
VPLIDPEDLPGYTEFQAMRAARQAADDERAAEARKLYSDVDGEPILRDSFVVFIDDLGTRARLATLTDDELRADIAAMDRLRYFLDDSRKGSNNYSRFMAFSDNVSVGAPLDYSLDDFGFLFLAGSVAAYQLNMTAGFGRFLRGAMTVGPLYMDDRFITGNGIVEAAGLEHAVAVHPRIIVPLEVLQLGLDADNGFSRRSRNSAYQSTFLIDEDDLAFIDYLQAGDADGIPGDAERAMVEHRAQIVKNLAIHAAPSTVREKYVWVADYHNYVASARFRTEPDFPIVDELTLAERATPRQFRTVYP